MKLHFSPGKRGQEVRIEMPVPYSPFNLVLKRHATGTMDLMVSASYVDSSKAHQVPEGTIPHLLGIQRGCCETQITVI